MNPESIAMIVFFACGTVTVLGIAAMGTVRKIVEARHKNTANPEEVNALRHEVAHLRESVHDLMLQMEYQRQSQPEGISERLTPPEFKERV